MIFSELNRFYLGRQSEGAGLLERPRPRAEDLDTEVHCKIYTQTQFLLRKVLWSMHLVALYKLKYKCNDWRQIPVFFLCVLTVKRLRVGQVFLELFVQVFTDSNILEHAL